MKNADRPAFPGASRAGEWSGLTKREEFIKAAMQGLCANSEHKSTGSKLLAETAISIADATLAEMER